MARKTLSIALILIGAVCLILQTALAPVPETSITPTLGVTASQVSIVVEETPAATITQQLNEDPSPTPEPTLTATEPAPATPTPSPTETVGLTPTASPIPAGEPVLIVCDYSTNPTTIKPGSTFTMSILICNAGTRSALKSLASFGGGAFIPSDSSRHQLGEIKPGKSARFEQELRAPISASPGVQTMTVNLHTSDTSGANYTFQQALNVEIGQSQPSGGGSPSSGAPRLVIMSTETKPESIQPGQSFELKLGINNLGKADANDVMIRAATNTEFMMANGHTFLLAGKIPAGASVEITLPLLVGDQLTPGVYSMDIDISYYFAGSEMTVTQAVSVGVQTSFTKRPNLIIAGYRTEPEQIAPGKAFDLYLELINVGGEEARAVTVTMGGENGLDLKPFSPLGSSNVKYVPGLAAGEMVEVVVKLLADGSAEARAFNLAIMLDFGGEHNAQYTQNQVISLLVHRKPMLRVDFYEAVNRGRVGSTMRLPVEVINLGLERVNILTMTISSEQVEISNGSAYIGRLESGGAFSIDATGKPKESGTLPMLVSIDYIDSFNQVQNLTFQLTVDVQEKAGISDSEGIQAEVSVVQTVPMKESFWQKLLRILKGFLGLGS
jgi:hypothetical protein